MRAKLKACCTTWSEIRRLSFRKSTSLGSLTSCCNAVCVEPGDAFAWTTGQLIYDDQPLAEVAE